MKNINSKILAIARTKGKEQTKTKLNQAYDLVNAYIRDTNYYIENATDIINDSIRITIAGNINEQLDTNKLKQFATVTKTVTKKNKIFLTLKILKKTISPKSDENETKKVNISKDKKILVTGRSPFAHVYDDGHNHEFNQEGYCYYCGINRSQIKTIEINLDDKIETSIEKVLKTYGWSDEYLRYQVRGIIFEINKGVKDGFKWFPDQTYLNEKIRKTLSRIEEIRHDNRVKALREQRRND